MLDPDRLLALIRANGLPAKIQESGQTWVRVELTDAQTGLSETVTMGISDFIDLVLHWRDHGCHKHPCLGIGLAQAHTHD